MRTGARRGGRALRMAASVAVLVLGAAGTAAVAEATPADSTTAASVTSARLLLAQRNPALPSVVGKTKAKAVSVLKARGYKVKTKTKTVKRGKNGVVLSQSPKARTRPAPGSTITLTISKVTKSTKSSSNCTPGYSPCLPPASDYDCAGGSGNGPEYVYGTVQVTGSDPYDLDRDGDGYGCD